MATPQFNQPIATSTKPYTLEDMCARLGTYVARRGTTNGVIEYCAGLHAPAPNTNVGLCYEGKRRVPCTGKGFTEIGGTRAAPLANAGNARPGRARTAEQAAEKCNTARQIANRDKRCSIQCHTNVNTPKCMRKCVEDKTKECVAAQLYG